MPLVQEPTITEAEVANVIKKISSGKSPKINEIPPDFIKVTGEEGTKTVKFCVKTYGTRANDLQTGKDLYTSHYLKKETRECSNYQTIAITSHASKVLLKIIQKKFNPT